VEELKRAANRAWSRDQDAGHEWDSGARYVLPAIKWCAVEDRHRARQEGRSRARRFRRFPLDPPSPALKREGVAAAVKHLAGMGQRADCDAVMDYLRGFPGFTREQVRRMLDELKTSGDYDRTLAEAGVTTS
jgi:hypothetical protein